MNSGRAETDLSALFLACPEVLLEDLVGGEEQDGAAIRAEGILGSLSQGTLVEDRRQIQS